MAHEHLDTTSCTPEYTQLFMPVYTIENLNLEKVLAIEKNFHAAIMSRAEHMVTKNNLILPMVTALLEKVIVFLTHIFMGGKHLGIVQMPQEISLSADRILSISVMLPYLTDKNFRLRAIFQYTS